MIVFLFLVALVVIGFVAGRMRRAPAALDGAALVGLAAVGILASSHILALVVAVLCLAGGFVGGATGDVRKMGRRRLGGGGGGLLGR
ncbi:MAG TPA: hypothetical protein VNL71_00840 [Chloroflexota bacterium]|nr:hypothetical protein [Chloroflexota bacterium]